MYLKRIEMAGFKSFPEKIKLEFNKGITAVVGPNGSGKSNISDAVRWVLGEQSAKNLRGAKMEDVIFAGTANRRPLGFAEVSLIIDNMDKILPVDFTEITVTRRVYRSGESEYKLNGVGCRLKDIHELFMDTGIGKEGYSIIGQGRIEEILSSKGEDRRLLFEEAAGIVKYKSRRYEAINKLEKEKQNIIRINDIVEEIENQLEPLNYQAEKARQYLKFAEQLKLVQVNIFTNEIDNAAQSKNRVAVDLENIKLQIQDIEQQKNILEQDNLRLKEDIHKVEVDIEARNSTVVELRSEIEQAENDIMLREEQKQHLLSDIKFFEDDITKKDNQVDQDRTALSDAKEALCSLTSELDEKRCILESKEQELADFVEKMSDSERQIELYNLEIIEQMRKANEIKSSYQQIQSLYEQLEDRKEQISNDRELYQEKLENKIQEIAEADEKLEKLNQQFISVSESLEVLAEEKRLLKQKEVETASALSAITRDHNDTMARIRLLSDLEKNYEGYYKSVKNILQHKKNNPNALKGVVGAVGELISVPKKYETAIEIALGQAIQNIVTYTEEDAKEAIHYLKSSNSGRATFLPISAITGRTIGAGTKDILNFPKVLGVAKDVIEYDSQYDAIISSLLGRVIISENMDSAIAFAKQFKYAYKVVTLDGEIINAGGAITGGSITQKNNGIFSRGREIKELKEKSAVLQADIHKLSETLEGVKRQLVAIRQQEEENRQIRQVSEVEKASLSQVVQQLYTDQNKYKNRLSDLTIEDQQLMEQIVAANKDLRDHEKKLVDVEKETEELKQSLNKQQSSIAQYRDEKDIKMQGITDVKVDISALDQKKAATGDIIARVEKAIEENKSLIQNYYGNIEEKNTAIEAKAKEIDALKLKIESLKIKQQEEARQLGQLENQKIELKETAASIEAQSQEKMQLLTRSQNEQVRLELKIEQIETDTAKLYDLMWEEYEMTYQQALEYARLEKPVSTLRSDEKELKIQIRDMGNVNVGAIEEYKLLQERYEFLTQQKQDIQEAEDKLKDIIMQLTKLMEEQFYEQFKIISDNFSTVFNEMFGGGKAYLRLSDEDNLLESGIDIIAQPPGKNLQTLSLLSGGERALTATALLFAILRMKPSPFCILDEIEAALDDANVVRYAEYLKNFCKDTQFILITHRKGVMEAADTLYGITMQEQGVSKLISVKFEDETA